MENGNEIEIRTHMSTLSGYNTQDIIERHFRVKKKQNQTPTEVYSNLGISKLKYRKRIKNKILN